MAYFEWANDMVIDNGPIDADHQLLVEQVNALHSATQEGRGSQVVGGLLDQLVNSTVEHIRREEELLKRIQYPDFERHKKGHDRFIHDLRDLQSRYHEGGFMIAARLSSLLRDWLSIHIRREDKKIYYHLRELEKAAAVDS